MQPKEARFFLQTENLPIWRGTQSTEMLLVHYSVLRSVVPRTRASLQIQEKNKEKELIQTSNHELV